MKQVLPLLLTVVFFIACSNKNEPIENPIESPTGLELPSELQKRVSQDNEFSFELLKNTILENASEQNIFISPLSMSIALGMVRNGAVGDTKTEINTALKLNGLTDVQINEYYRIMQTNLPRIDPLTKLSLANSIWYKTGFIVKPEFLQINTDFFNAEIRDLDFSQSWAVDTINGWCARNTNNLIKQPLDFIPTNTMMYLINAIYFKGIWTKKFDKQFTVLADFYTESGATTQANMMRMNDTIAYYEDQTAQYIDLPYGNKAYSMTVVLPKYGKTTTDALNNLSVDSWNRVIQGLEKQFVEVRIPRFKVKNKFGMNSIMQNMGMNLPFTDLADFSGISEDYRLLISRIIHSTYVNVDEDGTEAAAVTIVEVGTTSEPQHPVFRANRPFIFVIRENSTGVILFIGKIGKTAL